MGNTSSIELDEPEGPCTYVLVIGINKYEHPESSLDFEDLQTARHDAECLKEAFEYRASRSKQRRVVILPELDSSAEDIRETVKEIVAVLTENSVFIVIFSGHAMQVQDHWTYIVGANPNGYEDCIPMEGFLQECVKKRNLKYVHVCCFFLCCRSYEEKKHFPELQKVELEETNSYISVYVCPQGNGSTDWCHAAQALAFLLYFDEIYELWPLLTKFKEESMFLSLGSVQVEWSHDGIGGTVTLFTPEYAKMEYVKIMEESQMDCMIENAPLLRMILNEVSSEDLERATKLEVAKRQDQIVSVRKSIHDIVCLIERLVKSKRFEPIESEMKFWRMSSMQEIAAELRNMQTHRELGNKDLHSKECNIPYDVLSVIRKAVQAAELADLEAYKDEIRDILELTNQFCIARSFESAQAKKELVEGNVAAFQVPDVNLDTLPQSEHFKRQLTDELFELAKTSLAGLKDILDILITKGCLWIIILKSSIFSKEQIKQLQHGLAKIVSKYKRSAPVFAFAKEPRHRPLRALPARVLNLASLGRHIASQALESETFGALAQTCGTPCVLLEASWLSARLTAAYPEWHQKYFGGCIRVFEQGVEKLHGWLSGTKNLRFLEKNVKQFRGACPELEFIDLAVNYCQQHRASRELELFGRGPLKDAFLRLVLPGEVEQTGGKNFSCDDSSCSTPSQMEEAESLEMETTSLASVCSDTEPAALAQAWLLDCQRKRRFLRKCITRWGPMAKQLDKNMQWVLSAVLDNVGQDDGVNEALVDEIFWQKCCFALAKKNAAGQRLEKEHLLQLFLDQEPKGLIQIMQGKLTSDAVLVYYFTVPRGDEDVYLVLAVSHDWKTILPISNSTEVLFHVNEMVKLQSKRIWTTASRDELMKHGDELRKNLLDPVLAAVGCKHLIVSPDESLRTLAFQCLPFHSAPIIHNITVTYVLEPSDLINSTDFSGSPGISAKASKTCAVILAATGSHYDEHICLKAVETEVEVLSEILERQGIEIYVSCLQDEGGFEEELSQQLQTNKPAILHLSGPETCIPSPEKLRRMDLKGVQLVVLSTCCTSRDTVDALFSAGALSAIVCRSMCEDRTIPDFMFRLYNNLLVTHRSSRAEALQDAVSFCFSFSPPRRFGHVFSIWDLYIATSDMLLSSRNDMTSSNSS